MESRVSFRKRKTMKNVSFKELVSDEKYRRNGHSSLSEAKARQQEDVAHERPAEQLLEETE